MPLQASVSIRPRDLLEHLQELRQVKDVSCHFFVGLTGHLVSTLNLVLRRRRPRWLVLLRLLGHALSAAKLARAGDPRGRTKRCLHNFGIGTVPHCKGPAISARTNVIDEAVTDMTP